jgi:hypothetical protein
VGSELQTDQSLPAPRYSARYSFVGVCLRAIAVMILLFAVTALSVLAKDGLYSSRTSVARRTSDSTKMVPSHASAVFLCETQVVTKNRPLRPVRQTLPILPAIAPTNQIGVVVSMQHRSPPQFSTL